MPRNPRYYTAEFLKADAAARQRAYRARRVEKDPEFYKKNYYKRYPFDQPLFVARARLRQKNILQATPPWADRKELIEFYKNCPDGHHVDHIVPLKGENVCGLHVIENLQYLPAAENIRKSNSFEEVPQTPALLDGPQQQESQQVHS